MTPPPFTADDAERAHAEWGMNCGPAAVAAILGMTLDGLRPHLGDFEVKRYTNPTLMWRILRNAGARFSYRVGDLGKWWPSYGLACVQWEGPWTAPGVPVRAARRYTHWVGADAMNRQNIGIFDVNALGNGTGWCALADWETGIVPWILRESVPRASGGWHITHVVEIEP